ncbi:MAG: hypothetical protein AB7G93_12840 [Bdellovibrionales bacterium]
MKQVQGDQFLISFRTDFMVSGRGDHFRWLWPTFVVLSLFMGYIDRARGEWDLSVGATTRTYPLSGVIEAQTGYGALLWGDKGSPFYGYTRARLDTSSAIHYNSLGAAIEFFPLAFVGMRAGGEAVQNDRKYTAYECGQVNCLGRFYRTFAEAELSLGAGSLFVQGRWRREHWTQKEPAAGDFMEPTSGLVMRSQGDFQTVYQGLMGVNLNPAWAILAGLRYATNDEGDFSRFPFALARWRPGAFQVAAGGGVFESSEKSRDLSALLQLSWEIAPSIGLH